MVVGVHIWNITSEGVSPCDDLVNKTNSFCSRNSCQISQQKRKKETLGISHFDACNWSSNQIKKINLIQIYWVKFKLGWIEFRFNSLKIGCKLVQKVLKICLLLLSSMIMTLKKKQLSKDTNPTNHLYIIFCMIHNIPFGIIN